MTLTKEEYQILVNVLVNARTNNLQEATVLINLSNKLSGIIDGMKEEKIEATAPEKATK